MWEFEKAGAVVLMEMLRAVVTEFGGLAESVASTVMGEVPAAVGVPVMAPVLGFRVRPVGSVPAALQVIVPAPPVDCKAAV